MTEKPDALITLTTGKQDRGTRATLAFGPRQILRASCGPKAIGILTCPIQSKKV